MGKMKERLIDDMMLHPDMYIALEYYDFWMQCRKEELLEREGKPTIKLIRKEKSWKNSKKLKKK